MRKNRKKLYYRLGLIILAAVLLEIISAIQYSYMHSLMDEELEKHVLSELYAKSYILQQTLRSAEATLNEHLWDINRTIDDPVQIIGATERLLYANPDLVGACMAFTPDYFPQIGRLYEPYATKHGDSIITQDLSTTSDHDYTQHPAYQWVMQNNAPMWSDPYEYTTSEGRTALTTYTFPIHNTEGRIVALCGIDLSLKWLGDTLNTHFLYPSSFDLFLTSQGQLVAGPVQQRVSKQRVQEVVRLINDSTVQRHTTDDDRILSLDFTDPETHQRGYIYYMKMHNQPGWQVAFVCYDKEAFGQLQTMRLHILLFMLLACGLIALIVLRAIHNTQQLYRVNAEKRRIDNELRVAHDLQHQMLPPENASFGANGEIALSASLVPAKEVGGDLFDYFLHNDKLYFCIGDVSGKGIPAAMLMAKTITLFRDTAAHLNSPAHMMQTINKASCQNNEANMFVTLFIGILDLPTGKLHYCNAGHEHPYINGQEIDIKPNMPVGAFEDFQYTAETTTLPSDALLFLYTDGLTEAMNSSRKLFGQQRVTEILQQCNALPPAQVLDRIKSEVQTFVGAARQSDDLTLLTLRYTKA